MADMVFDLVSKTSDLNMSDSISLSLTNKSIRSRVIDVHEDSKIWDKKKLVPVEPSSRRIKSVDISHLVPIWFKRKSVPVESSSTKAKKADMSKLLSFQNELISEAKKPGILERERIKSTFPVNVVYGMQRTRDEVWNRFTVPRVIEIVTRRIEPFNLKDLMSLSLASPCLYCTLRSNPQILNYRKLASGASMILTDKVAGDHKELLRSSILEKGCTNRLDTSTERSRWFRENYIQQNDGSWINLDEKSFPYGFDFALGYKVEKTRAEFDEIRAKKRKYADTAKELRNSGIMSEEQYMSTLIMIHDVDFEQMREFRRRYKSRKFLKALTSDD